MCSGIPYAEYVKSGGKLNFVDWMKEGSGANVFDFAKLLSTAREGGAGPDGTPSSEITEHWQVIKAAEDISDLLEPLGSAFVSIFNNHQADNTEPDPNGNVGRIASIGIPVSDQQGLRRQVELAHPEPRLR